MPAREDQTELGTPRPETYEEFLALLASDGDRLPKRLRAVAIQITQNPDDVALKTISALSDATGTPPSTLVRFAKTFGFSGFSEFQALFKTHLKSGLRGPVRPGGTSEHVLSGLIAAAQSSLDTLDKSFDAFAFDAMARALSDAPVIYLIGAKRAFPVVTYLSLTFLQHGLRAILIDNIGATALDHLRVLGPGDCVLAVSFSPYNSPTPDLARIARDRGARVLALTDSALSPLVPLADLCLTVAEKSDAGYRTLAATMVTALGLVVEASALRRASGRLTEG